MLGSVSVKTAIEKNRIASKVPFFVCLEIDLLNPSTGGIAEQLYLVANNEDITYQGQLYTAYPFDLDLNQEAGAEASVSLTIDDVAGAVQERMQAYGGAIGSAVRIVVLNAGLANVLPRSNLLLRSDNLTHASWTKNGVTTNPAVPVGGISAMWNVTSSALNEEHRIRQNFTTVLGTAYWAAAKIKDGGYRYARLGIPAAGFAAAANLAVDLQTGQVRYQDAGVAQSKVTRLDGGLYLVEMLTAAATGAATSELILSTLAADPVAGPTLSFLGDGVSGFQGSEVQIRPSTHSDEYQFTYDATVFNKLPDYPPEITETFEVTSANSEDFRITWQLGAEQHLGLSFPRRIQSRSRCRWKYKGPECAYAGGLTSCDYSLSGSNGCAVHGNEPRFGGFPGISSGR